MANKEFIARHGLLVTGDANLTGNLVVAGNNIVSSIKAAYDAANAAGSGATVSAGFEAANAAFNTANSAYTSSNSAFAQANTANALAFKANVNAIAAFVAANAAFNKANAGSNVTFTQFVIKGGGNLTVIYANSNSSSFNIETGNGITYANTANGLNLGLTTTGVTASYYGGSSAIPVVQIDQFGRIVSASNVSINQAAATAAYDTANAAYNNANTKLATTGGTITGDLSVAGNLYVTGNTTFITANTLRVSDPLLYLAGNNYSSDLVDIGFIANYVNGTGQNVHTGLYREHENKMYYLFNGYDAEPLNNHIGAMSNNMTLAVLNADLITSNLWLGGQNTINWINAAFTRANASATAVNGTIIIDNTVGNQKLANVSQGTVKGRANGSGTGEVQDLSYSQFIDQMPIFSNTINGVVPKTVTRSNRFLRDDATWQSVLQNTSSTFNGDLTVKGNTIFLGDISANPSTRENVPFTTANSISFHGVNFGFGTDTPSTFDDFTILTIGGVDSRFPGANSTNGRWGDIVWANRSGSTVADFYAYNDAGEEQFQQFYYSNVYFSTAFPNKLNFSSLSRFQSDTQFDGFVTIKRPSPGGYELDVVGTINASAILVNGSALGSPIPAFNAANAAFNQANTANLLAFRANVNAAAAFAQANIAIANVNFVNTMAQAAFAQANIANTTAIAAFNKANISSAGGISLNAQNTAPTGVANNLWFNTDTGELYVYHTDFDGTSQWVQINGNGAGVTSLRNVDYYHMFFYQGQVDANVVMYLNMSPTTYTLPANLTGSYARVATAPSGNNANLRIMKNDSYVGNISFARNNTNGTFVFANTLTFVPGDVFKIMSPVSVDVNMSDIAITLLGAKN